MATNICLICAKQFLCNKKECKPIKYSQTKDYGEVTYENERPSKSKRANRR